jgi:hypothetical protein
MCNDSPRSDHGVHTLYEFAADAGDMERSRFFGISKDLYHLDHFLAIRSFYPLLFRNDGAFHALHREMRYMRTSFC